MFRPDEDMAIRPSPVSPAKADEARRVRRLRNLAGLAAIGFWMAWGALALSWPGNRPMIRDHDHPYAYTTNGLFFVSAGDLVLSYGLIACSVALMIAMAVLHRRAAKLVSHPARGDLKQDV